MDLQAVLLFLVSLIAILISSWSLSTFMRLNEAADKYSNNRVFESACQMSKEYVNTGVKMGAVLIAVLTLVIFMASYNVYKSF